MSIKGYILTLLGVAILSVLIDVIMPSGKMQKFVKSMFSILILTAIIMPIISLINSDFNLTSSYKNEIIKVDTDFLDATNKKIYKQIETSIETEIKNIGYSNVLINITFETNNYSTKISNVQIDISNIEINKNKPHKEIKSDILDIVYKYISYNKEIDIIFIE